MSNEPNRAPSTGHGDYERRDIGIAGVLYFLIGLAVALVFSYYVVDSLYRFLENRSVSQQKAVSPLVTTTPTDTRRLPPEYKTDSQNADYEKYLEKNFPMPQLETNERNELNRERLREEQTLSTYDYVDKNAGTIRIPIDRAMELVARRGLPVREESAIHFVAPAKPERRGSKK